jgi:rod shape-determining protein MreC
MPRKNTLLLLILIIFSLILMTYQSKKGHLLSNNFISNLHSNAQVITKSMTDTIKNPFKRKALLEAENKLLQKRIDEILMEREKYREAILGNRRLKNLLDLRDRKKNFISSAKVISKGLDHWTKILTINKGLKDGILKDMVAITPRGLTGKIINVSDSYSQLLLVTDINFSASVRLQKSRKEGIVSGTGTRKCVLKYIPFDEEVKVGDIIITSGLDSLFPPGIPVGYISKIDNKNHSGHFQNIEVAPFQDDTKIEEIIIIQ